MLKHIAKSTCQLFLILMLGLLLFFDGCGNEGFQAKNGKPSIVSITGAGKTVRTIPGADAKTFRSLDNAEDARVIYAVDAKRVYLGLSSTAMSIKSSDPASFSILTPDGTYAADNKQVYWYGVKLEGADPSTFRVIKAPYAADAKQVYVGVTPLDVHSVEDFVVLEVYGFDSPIKKQGTQFVAKDRSEAHVSGWAQDGISYYCGATELKDADYESLIILNECYAKDKKTVYFDGKSILGADAESFVIEGPGSIRGRDKKFQYKSGKQIVRVDK